MFYLRKFTNLSYAVIGREFGKDHATVIHALKSVNDQAEVYAFYRDELEIINCKIKDTLSEYFERYKHYDTDKT